ncbi:MAG: hypothetical protein H0U20_07785 [Thermoleophilaceae bacterium]|nr:hypothetical protein [Thermoleophilaceae bacterium]
MQLNDALAGVFLLAGLAGVTVLASVTTFVDDLARGFTVGGGVGTFVAYRRHLRRPELDPFPIITRWAGFGTLASAGAAALG